ncbi:MAG: hypothetical protein KJ955_01275 [Nanoarchaeota archaeon]|nr:hypothetical protein [Nanoarchaeota archaeon]
MSLETEVRDSNDRFVQQFAKQILDAGYCLTGAVSTCAQFDPLLDESYCHVALISPGNVKRKDDTLLAIIKEVILPPEFEGRRVFMKYIEFNPNEKEHRFNF